MGYDFLTEIRSGCLVRFLRAVSVLKPIPSESQKSYNRVIDEIKTTRAGHWSSVPMPSEHKSLFIDLKNKANESKFVLPRFR